MAKQEDIIMGDIIQFPSLKIECSNFTSDALKRFRDIPKTHYEADP